MSTMHLLRNTIAERLLGCALSIAVGDTKHRLAHHIRDYLEEEMASHDES